MVSVRLRGTIACATVRSGKSMIRSMSTDNWAGSSPLARESATIRSRSSVVADESRSSTGSTPISRSSAAEAASKIVMSQPNTAR